MHVLQKKSYGGYVVYAALFKTIKLYKANYTKEKK